MTFIGVGEWLDRREQLSPERIALVDVAAGQRLTYRELNIRARALATLLAERHGLRQGDRVAILAANCPEYLDALFACALLGAILVPLNWRLTAPELRGILSDCEPALLLHDAAHRATAVTVSGLVGGQPGVHHTPLLALEDFPGVNAALAARAMPFATADGKLARYKIPKRVVFCEVLPRNAMGKVIKAELAARYAESRGAADRGGTPI